MTAYLARVTVFALVWTAAIGAAVATPEQGPAWTRVDIDRLDLETRFGAGTSSMDYGSFQWLADPSLDFTAVAALRAREDDHPYVLHLGGRSFDPLVDLPAAEDSGGQSTSANWYLIQLFGPSRRIWLQQLLATGLQPVQYIHPYTYIVWGENAQIAAASELEFVRWTGPFLPDYRLDGQDDSSDEILHVLVLTARFEDNPSLIEAVSGSGGVIRAINAVNRFLQVMYMTLPNVRGSELAKIPGVYAVQVLREPPATRGEAQNQVNIGARQENGTVLPGYLGWLSTIGYDGHGITAAVVDQGGIRSSHIDLVGRLAQCMPMGSEISSCSSEMQSNHATHVAGAIAGTGASGLVDHNGFLRGLGVAPGTRILSQQFNTTLSGDDLIPGGILAIFRESVLNGAQLANNSWGLSTRARGYDIPTMQVDMIVRDADPATIEHEPLLPIWAIMNGHGDGQDQCAPGSLGTPDEAKNLLAVGATDLLDAGGSIIHQQLSDLSIRSGHGNACDGRRVPHLVAPGCSTDNPTAAHDRDHGHLGYCGTSMAAPNVTGAASIFMERYRDLYGRLPSPALVKAALTAVAVDLVGHQNADRSAAMGHRPDRFQGFGRLNLDAAVNPADRVLYFDQEHVFTDSGQQWRQPIYADDPNRPMQIMLAWTDAPGHGLGGDTPAWVNDLDLMVSVDGVLYRGNVIGAGGWSVSGGEADGKNNLEAVFLAAEQLQSGRVDLSVLAANIAADALDPYQPDFAAPRQDFALVCYNCSQTPPPALNHIFGNGFE